jgi:CheY-like chemotaxis protein
MTAVEELSAIAMNAQAMRGDRERGIRSGMDDYISKSHSCRTLDGVPEFQLLSSTRYTSMAGRTPANSPTNSSTSVA